MTDKFISGHRSYKIRKHYGEGEGQYCSITNNPSTIDANQNLKVDFKNLAQDEFIVPGTSRLAFNIELTGTDANKTIVQNIGRAIVQRITIRIAGNPIQTIEDADIYYCYEDLWKTSYERKNAVYQGIDTSKNANVNKIRIGAGDKDATIAADVAVAGLFGNRFSIPLDFELLETDMPFYQTAFNDTLEYEFTIKKFADVIKATGTDCEFKISNITLEFRKIKSREIANEIKRLYESGKEVLFDRIHRYTKEKLDKKDTQLTIHCNMRSNSLKGVLLFFKEDETNFSKDPEKFYNPKITKIEVSINGMPNKVYDRGMLSHHLYEAARRLFSGGLKKSPTSNSVCKELQLSDMTIDKFANEKFAVWIDFRLSEDDRIHENGVELRSAGDSIELLIHKKAEAAGNLTCHGFFISHAKINFANGRFVNMVY
jgi:hypothetical protein